MSILWLTAIRLILPLSILKWPLIGVVASAFFDIKDWHLYSSESRNEVGMYQAWDKLLDAYYLGIAMLVSLRWKEVKARIASIVLYCYRLFGILLFLITGSQAVLFIFPNIFENFFLFYMAFLRFSKKESLFSSNRLLLVILLAVGIPKVIQEFFLHVAKKFPWEVFPLPGTSEYAFWVWMAIYISIPAIALLWITKRRIA